MLLMVCGKVLGLDTAIVWGGLRGNFELNTSLPLLAHDFLEAGSLLTRAVSLFSQRCVRGLEADAGRCRWGVDRNSMLATALVPRLGHARAVAIAQEAMRSGRSLREVALEKEALTEAELDILLDARKMTEGPA
jgi:fumarate hydratase class II